MSSPKRAFAAGARDISPIILGVIPFALIAGISAVGVGLSELEALGMSYIVFAGASQLAAVDLVGRHAPVAVIVLTALVINLRFCMYSASLAPHFHGLPLHWRAPLAYLLTDQAYAISITAFGNGRMRHKHWYYLGAAMTMWVTWQTGTAAGVFLGAAIPKSWSLDFAIPLTFLALLFPAIKDRPSLVAAASAGALALAGHGLPYNLGLFLAALGGIGAGALADGGKHHAP
ncbi:branched-chain amino acid transporter AzlC [Desulfuromonas versatilis]|uniref:Branched-chain amino acid transporter AzlC n=1 Tax=Desulfuromonas versatilis TaxID=2802975 RepID=A0ABN6DX01_9BACT|nr:AzlC family ABC transporter permease [Desulfuromonas versatilis]BCR04327.1 branched-chain amino acid transporter AzlC [Desulfuromonas versatilis]